MNLTLLINLCFPHTIDGLIKECDAYENTKMILQMKLKELEEAIKKHEETITEYQSNKAMLDKKVKEQDEDLKKHAKMIDDLENTR